jgi:hypothetical protein
VNSLETVDVTLNFYILKFKNTNTNKQIFLIKTVIILALQVLAILFLKETATQITFKYMFR